MNITEIPLSDLTKSFRQLYKFLSKRWWIFLVAGILGGGLGIVYAYLSKPKYTAFLSFALEDNGSGLSGALSLAAEFGLNIGSGRDVFAGDNILQIMSSRRIIESVLLSVDSAMGNQTFMQQWAIISGNKKNWLNNKRLKDIDFPAGIDRKKFTYLQDSLLYVTYKQIAKSNLIAERPDKKLNIYQVTFTSFNERFSKIFIEKLLSETTSLYMDLRSSRSRQTLKILEDRVAQLRGSVSSSISMRSNVQDANLNPAFAKAQIPLQQSQVDMSMYGAALTELYKNLELARYQYLKDVPLLQVIDLPAYPLEYKRPRKLYSAILGAFAFGFILLVYLTVFAFPKSVKFDSNRLS